MSPFLDKTRYCPADKSLYEGRKEPKTPGYFHEIVKTVDLNNDNLKELTPNAFSLLGFGCDAGIERNSGRPGAKSGPDAFRKQFGKLALPAPPYPPFYDFGTILCEDGNLEASRGALTKALTALHQNQQIPVVIGGGHELSFPHYAALSEAYPEARIGIFQLDAHFDLRPLENGGTSGTSFTEIAKFCHENKRSHRQVVAGIQPLRNSFSLFQRAKELSISYFLFDELFLVPENLTALIEDSDILYVSVCLDVFNAAFAPGVSAPESLGILPQEALLLLRQAKRSSKLAVLDIAELSPPLDRDNQTARLAASLAASWLTYDKP